MVIILTQAGSIDTKRNVLRFVRKTQSIKRKKYNLVKYKTTWYLLEFIERTLDHGQNVHVFLLIVQILDVLPQLLM